MKIQELADRLDRIENNHLVHVQESLDNLSHMLDFVKKQMYGMAAMIALGIVISIVL
jgi:hypothetical protein